MAIFVLLLIGAFLSGVAPRRRGYVDGDNDTSTPVHEDQRTVQHDEYTTRLNYGFAAINEKQVSLVHGYWTHTFHVTLPSLDDSVGNQSRAGARQRLARCTNVCEAMRPMHGAVVDMTRNFRRSVRYLVDRIKFLIPELPVPQSTGRTRRGRGLIDAVGFAGRYLFGVAVTADVQGLRKSFETVKTVTSAVAADAARTRAGLATFAKLSNERFDRMHEMLRQEETTFVRFYTKYQDVVNTTTSVVAAMAKEISMFVSLHDDLAQIEVGIESLIHGQLSPKLIPHETLSTTLDTIRRQLDARIGTLIYPTALETYALKNFDYARIGDDLIVRLHLPYRQEGEMSVSRVETFALPVPGKQGLVSSLTHMPRYVLIPWVGTAGIVSHSGVVGVIGELPDRPVIHYADVQWYGRDSCISALLRDDHAGVHQRCDFSVRRGAIEPRIVRLDVGLFIASDPTVLEISCPHEQPRAVATDQILKLVRLRCGCSLRYRSAVYVLETAHCEANFSQTEAVFSAVNLAVLQHFYDLSDEIVSGSRLYTQNESSPPAPLQISLFGENVTQLIADDREASYSLTKLAEHLQNNSVVVHSQAEALFYKYIASLPDQASWLTDASSWTFWSLSVVNAVVMIVIVYLLCAVRVLRGRIQAVAATTGVVLTRLSKGFQLRTQAQLPTPTPTEEGRHPFALFDADSFFATDYFVITIIVALVVFLIFVRCLEYHCTKGSRSSLLYVVVRTSTSMVEVLYYQFPDASRNYTLQMRGERLDIDVVSYGLFGHLHVIGRRWQVKHTLTGRRVVLPASVWIGYRKLRQLKALLRDNPVYVVVPLIAHSHQYDYVIPEVLTRRISTVVPGDSEAAHTEESVADTAL